jgi:hypothetical protein
MGVSNKGLCPPFIPVGRNSDGVFGYTLGLLDRRAIFAHIPVGIVHDSDRPSQYDAGIPSASGARLADLILEFTASCTSPVGGTGKLRDIGRHLQAYGAHSASEFLVLAYQAFIASKTRLLSLMDDEVDQTPCCQAFWRKAISSYRTAFFDASRDPEAFIPSEVKHLASMDEMIQTAQSTVNNIGRLYDVWPSILSAADDMQLQLSETFDCSA